jgi:hypothetical protein
MMRKKPMRAMGGKMAKGYSKGGSKMMKAMGGKMAKGYSKGGAKMMKAMGGKMAKGYSKGGAKMIRAQSGKEIKRPKNMISNVRGMDRPKLKVKPTGMKPLPKSVQKIAGAIDKLPRSGKLALFGTYIAGLGYGTKKAMDYLGPKAKKAKENMDNYRRERDKAKKNKKK